MFRYLYKTYRARTEQGPDDAKTRKEKEKKLCHHQQQAGESKVFDAHDAARTSTKEFSDQAKTQTTLANGPCQECKAEKRRRTIYRWKLIIALFPCQFLSSIDTTIVATALTTISSHFNQLQEFNWIVTAYTLTSTAFIPAYGQIADTFGRHVALQVSMFFMLIGSVLCAAAQNWAMLLFGRALQGLSAAGIMNMIKIVLSDKVTLAEQASNSTIFALVTGISFAVGPIIGGSLATSNWRYCFVISIPITVLSQILIFLLLRKELVHGTHHLTGPKRKSFFSGISTVDFGGTALFVFGAGLIIIGTSWGGTKYEWSSYKVLLPLVIGSLLFAFFFVYEYLLEPGNLIARRFPKQVAMIPFSLFQRRDALLLAIINAATGAALYSAFYFVGIFWTLVQNYTPEKAGLQLLYYTPGIGVGVYSAMFICNIFPRQTFYPLFLGSVIEATGFGVLTWAISTRNSTLVNVMMAIAGGGTGLRFMPNTLHAAGIWHTKIASVMSLMDFALPFGGTVSIAIMSSVFYNKFAASVSGMNVGTNVGSLRGNNTQSLQGINSLPPAAQLLVREKAARAVMWSFISVLPIMALSVISATVLGNVWIKPAKDAARSRSKGDVIYTSFLWALFTGKIKSRKQPIDEVEDDSEALEKTDASKSRADNPPVSEQTPA